MKKVIIVGAGPAGISAALYTARAGLSTLVIARDVGALERAESIGNYYGFTAPQSGAALAAAGRAGAEQLGVDFLTAEVTGLTYNDGYTLLATVGDYHADGVVLATGARRRAPKLPGLPEFAGRGVSYCATCDAFACRGKPVFVLGNGEYAYHQAKELSGSASSVTILTNGAAAVYADRDAFPVIQTPIARIAGDTRVRSVVFADGSETETAMVFVALGTAGSTELAEGLGLYTEGGKISVDATMSAGLPGLFAAGDCTGGLLQVAKAG